jgi:hypothetical protein
VNRCRITWVVQSAASLQTWPESPGKPGKLARVATGVSTLTKAIFFFASLAFIFAIPLVEYLATWHRRGVGAPILAWPWRATRYLSTLQGVSETPLHLNTFPVRVPNIVW